MRSRPYPSVAGAAALAVVCGLGLARAVRPAELAAGVAAGAGAGCVAGWWAARRGGGRADRVGRFVGAGAVLVGGLVAVTADWRILTRLSGHVTTFLTVGLPAGGLDGLAAVPYLVTALVASAAVAAARRARPELVVVAAAAGLLLSAMLVVPVGVPPLVPVAFGAVLAGGLMVASRFDHSDLEPLVGTSTAIRRNQHWWRPAAVGVPAAALGLVALILPRPAGFDVRDLVEPDVEVRVDENPLAVAARLLTDPPPAAVGTDVAVSVTGTSPGRLRLAVLDGYRPQGWHQLAEYAVTGTALAPGLFGRDGRDGRDLVVVTVTDGPAVSGFAALPTAGTPTELADAAALRYAPAAGLLLAGGAPGSVTYRTWPDRAVPPGLALGTPPGVDPALAECPDSSVVRDAALVLTESASDPLTRLEAIGSWLKLRRIYDPAAPGGQTIGGVERFVAQEFARGNLEVFVTAFALLARCAGVPVRVVVGYPAPAADGRTDYRPADVTAWVEVPLAGVGWVGVDPRPSAAEQQRQAELAAAPPPPSGSIAPDEGRPEGRPVEVAPIAPGRPNQWEPRRVAVAASGAVLLVVAAATAWSLVVRRRTRRRRARVADPALAALLAWTTVLERFSDLGTPLGAHLTAREMARATADRVAAPVTPMMAELATIVDRARFGGDRATAADAGTAWALADECLARLPAGWAVATAPLRHPRRAVARLRLARGAPRRPSRWTGEVPPSAVVLPARAVPDVAGYEIEARVGGGASAAVFRARQDGTGRAVAVKVFHADVSRRDFDHQRFVWEARVAELVSGQPGLPEVLDSGFTGTGHPYLVTKLYRHGTLERRVRVGRPLRPDEVVAAGRQLATALDALHQNGVVHGDVKPENVFVDDDDTLVLGDLGAAWVHTLAGPAASPTPAYAAPEVWLGRAPTAASDIYSLGLTLMFAATGRVPRVGAPPDESEVVDAFGSAVAVRLLEVDPRRRFRSALAVANHFGAELDERTVGAGSAPYRLPPPSWTFRE